MYTHKDYRLGPVLGGVQLPGSTNVTRFQSQNLDLNLVQDFHVQKY